MVKPIVKNLVELKKPCKRVETEDITQLVEDLRDTLRTQEGYGLAAPQIGVNLQVAYILFEGKELILVNPKILNKESLFEVKKEGCLSIPGLFINTDRYKYIRIMNGLEGKIEHNDYSDMWSIIIQHELDHLKGIIITDRKHTKKR